MDKSSGTIELCTPGHATEEAFWIKYGDAMVAALEALPARHGGFLTNCPTHCETGVQLTNPARPGVTLSHAIAAFYPAAIAHGKEPGWSAPRFVAADGDGCLI